MKAKTYVMLAATATMLAVAPAMAQDQDRDRLQDIDLDQLRDRDRIYGYDLMTPEEHEQLFLRLQEAETAEERARIMEEHRLAMEERVRAVLGMIGPAQGPGVQGGGGGGQRSGGN